MCDLLDVMKMNAILDHEIALNWQASQENKK